MTTEQKKPVADAHTISLRIIDAEKNRGHLQTDHEVAARDYETARAAVVQNSSQANIDIASLAHSKVATISDALSIVEGSLAEMRVQLQEAEARELREQQLTRLEIIEVERNVVRETYLRERLEAAEGLEKHLIHMMEHSHKWNSLVNELHELRGVLGMPVPPARTISEMGQPPLVLAEAIDSGLNTLRNRRYYLEQDRSNRERDEQRRAREERTEQVA